jgi:hypothetical protein
MHQVATSSFSYMIHGRTYIKVTVYLLYEAGTKVETTVECLACNGEGPTEKEKQTDKIFKGSFMNGIPVVEYS